jgi:hypothetical protein
MIRFGHVWPRFEEDTTMSEDPNLEGTGEEAAAEGESAEAEEEV